MGGRTIGSELKRIRKTKGLQQAWVAHQAGIETTSLSRIENGVRRPSQDALDGICRALGVRYEWTLVDLGAQESFIQVPVASLRHWQRLVMRWRQLSVSGQADGELLSDELRGYLGDGN